MQTPLRFVEKNRQLMSSINREFELLNALLLDYTKSNSDNDRHLIAMSVKRLTNKLNELSIDSPFLPDF